MGLEIERREFYNLIHKQGEMKLSNQEEACMIITYLNNQGCHVFINEVYILDNLGNKTDCVIQYII
jgi:hypothetical protein